MLTLALDSSAKTASVALLSDGIVLSELSSQNKLNHSVRLLPMIEEAFFLADADKQAVDLFSVAAGPGSFTGIRIGVSTIKGLAFGKNTPCAAVSTLEALAQNLVDATGIFCPVMDARRGEFYNALFACENGKLTRLTPDRAISGEALLAEISALSKPLFVNGDGADLFRSFCPAGAFRFCEAGTRTQRAVSVALCGERLFRDGHTVDPQALIPHYVRRSGAERKRKETE